MQVKYLERELEGYRITRKVNGVITDVEDPACLLCDIIYQIVCVSAT